MRKYFLAALLLLLLNVLAGVVMVWGAYMAGGLAGACMAGAFICFVAALLVLEII